VIGMRAVVRVVAGVLILSSLSGCASQTEKYCSTLKDDNKTLQKLASGSKDQTGDQISQSLDVFKDLQGKAPQDVADEWDTFVTAWQDLSDAFDTAGVDPGKFKKGVKPSGVSEGQYDAIKRAAEGLQSQPVLDAAQGIEQHARDVCKVDLGESGSGL
jgi:hypothetical protein